MAEESNKQSKNERIEEFLRERYVFRFNTIKSRSEWRMPNEKIFNSETRQYYRAENSTAHISTDQTNGKMSLNINNQPHNEWFNEQQHRRMYPHIYRDKSNRGRKI